MSSYLDYFNRQVMLWGKTKQESLQGKKIAVIGSGGLGSSLAMALGASGIGHIDFVDFDEVSLHNIHRQIAFTTEHEGQSKARIVADLQQKRSPYVRTQAYIENFETFAKRQLSYDLLLDATDNLPSRAQIDAYAKAQGIPWIYGSVEAFNGQVCFLEASGFDTFKVMERKPAGIAAPMVMHVASLQANLALRYLADEPVKKDWLYYLYFNDEGELVTQKFQMPVP